MKRVEVLGRTHGLLESDPEMRPFFEGATNRLPKYYVTRMRRAMGPLWDALPRGAIAHDPNAFRKNPGAFNVVNKPVRANLPRALVA